MAALDTQMKHFLFIALYIYSYSANACNGNKDELALDVNAKLIPNSELIAVEISAPHESKKFRLSGAGFYQGENYIPMYRGYEESGIHMYYLKGKKEFLLNAVFKVSYTGKESLCLESRDIDLKDVIKNCSSCS